MKNRLEWIDISKGLAIILVVVGHAAGASVLGKYIYAFHMPLFFIISGMCFINGKYEYGEFAKKRFRQLIVPALFLTVLSIVIIEVSGLTYDFSDLKVGLPGALWFLPVLFMVEILYFPIAKRSIRGGLVAFAILGLLLAKKEIALPYSLCGVPAALVYYGLGNVFSYSRIIEFSQKLGHYKLLVCLVLLSLPCLRIFIYPHHLYLFNNEIEWVDFVIAPLASIGIFLLSMMMEKLMVKSMRMFIWLGNNTMMIMAIHLPIMKVMSGIRPLVGSYVCYKLLEEVAMWSVSCFLAYLANKYVPFIVGKRK